MDLSCAINVAYWATCVFWRINKVRLLYLYSNVAFLLGFAEILFGYGTIHEANVMHEVPSIENIKIRKDGHLVIGHFSESELLENQVLERTKLDSSNKEFQKLSAMLSSNVKFPVSKNPSLNFFGSMKKINCNTLKGKLFSMFFTPKYIYTTIV